MRIWLRPLILFTVLLSCQKETQSFVNNAVITGINVSTGMESGPIVCEGIFYFHFTDILDTSDIAINNPDIFRFPHNRQFPIRVSVDYQKSTRCGLPAIDIISYKIL